MDAAAIRKMIADLASEEDNLLETAKYVEAKLDQVRAARAALAALESDPPVKFEGKLSEACRAVLKQSAKSLSPTEVRDHLIAIGYDLGQHTNPMASIHSVLKRLAEAKKDVGAKDTKDGSARYFWTGDSTRSHRTISDLTRGATALRTSEDVARIAANLQEFQKTYSNAFELFKNDKLLGPGGITEFAKQLERLRAEVKIPQLPPDLEEAIGLKPKK
jgi:hypothetical protein